MTSILTGAWQLTSWQISYSDDRPITQPFGSNPDGLIMYSENGWMSAAINRQHRPSLNSHVGLRQQPDDALAKAYKSYFHYSGTYKYCKDYVYHHVTQSLNPDFVGSIQKRKVEFKDGQLILSGVDHIGDIQRTHTLTWQATV